MIRPFLVLLCQPDGEHPASVLYGPKLISPYANRL